MYKSYKASTGRYERDDNIENTLRGINERRETIVSVTAVGIDNFWVLIITEVHAIAAVSKERPPVRQRLDYIDRDTGG